MYIGIPVKYQLFLLDFKETWTVSTNFSKNTQIPNFIKFCSVGTKSFQADRRTERCDGANRCLPQFCKHD